MFFGQVLITENRNLASGYYRMTVAAPEVVAAAKPGQFVQVRVAAPEYNDPLLARPLSMFKINEIEDSISLIYKIVGRGTAILAGLKAGELLEILGPIGKGFSLPENARNIALIAGGVGMPPLFCFAEYLQRVLPNCRSTLFYGGRTASDLLELDQWAGIGVKTFIATEDGSQGYQGLVTEIFLTEQHQKKFDFLAACGPQPMLQALQKIALTEAINGQFSLEAYMACGVGACLGCTCETSQGYKRVCVDGPVFSLHEVVWS